MRFFYNNQIKMALAAMNNKEIKPEDLVINCKIMEEFEMKKHVDCGFKEFGERIFIEKSFVKN